MKLIEGGAAGTDTAIEELMLKPEADSEALK
jgi:hypothetical protein